MEHPGKVFRSLFFLWKKTQTCELAGDKNTHVHKYLNVCLSMYLSVYLSTCMKTLFRGSSLCRVRDYSASLGYGVAIRNHSHLMALWFIVTDQRGDLFLEFSELKQ